MTTHTYTHSDIILGINIGKTRNIERSLLVNTLTICFEEVSALLKQGIASKFNNITDNNNS